ncbi:hypothetical protein TWF132_010510 [Orbilia oligospora]|nr:hypothetical protein TWF132_010510 [Orbilia oligospora]
MNSWYHLVGRLALWNDIDSPRKTFRKPSRSCDDEVVTAFNFVTPNIPKHRREAMNSILPKPIELSITPKPGNIRIISPRV